MKLGITLPSFEKTATAALATARQGELAGLDGLFVFDHLWPGDDRSRPALSVYPLLGAVAVSTRRIQVGPLVARLGLVPDEVVIQSLVTVEELSSGRLIAALGIGDEKSLAENQAYGIEWPAKRDRLASLTAVLGALASERIEAWVGASAPATIEVARAAGAPVNLWNCDLERVRAEVARGPTTWAGPLPSEPSAAARRLLELRDAGVTWAIWGWPRSVDLVKKTMALAGMQGGGA